jgi:hypothetical protein
MRGLCESKCASTVKLMAIHELTTTPYLVIYCPFGSSSLFSEALIRGPAVGFLMLT